MLTSPELIFAARIAIGMNREELAVASGVSNKTVYKIETGKPVATRSFVACQKVLEDRGVEFFFANNRIGFSVPGKPGLNTP